MQTEPYSDHYEQSRLVTPEQYVPDAYERTLEGYVGLLSELRETQRALSQDFKVMMSGNRPELERLAAPHIDRINTERRKLNQEAIPVTDVSEHFLLGIAEPAWKDHMPKDPADKDAAQTWETFKGGFGDSLSDNLEVLYELHAKIDVLQDDEQLQAEFHGHRAEQIKTVAAATSWHKQEARREQLTEDIASIRERASQSGRALTTRERARIDRLTAQLTGMQDILLDPTIDQAAFVAELDRLDRRGARKELESGLLMTDQMKDIISEALPALLRGEPVLLVGETGGAKTALAEYIARKYLDVEPELISGYGDVNSYQLMGKQELREQHGATVSDFVAGPLVRAMESGRPVILDEINAMPAELLKRLNKIMQLRPGDTFTIQEDSGREVVVKQGFCVIATANEKSKRYKGVDDLSVEFQNRFGANIYRVRYPDHAVAYGDPAVENDRLAMAAVVDKRGNFPADIDPHDFDNFVRACFVSQQVFSGNHGEGFTNYVTTERQLDDKPGLEETVLAPRTMIDMLAKVAGSHGEVSIKQACARFLDGIKNPHDKKVLHQILAGHNLLETGS